MPTGVVTTVLGGIFLAVAAHRLSPGGAGPREMVRIGMSWGRRHPAVVIVAGAALVVAAGTAALLLGDSLLLLGDVGNWLGRQASRRVGFILDARAPRVASALLAGAALALAGALVQSVTRNALADPGILGVSSGAGLGAVVALTVVTDASWLVVSAGAAAGALAVAALLFALTLRGGLNETRVVLVGIGLAAATSAITSAILVRSDPWNQAKADHLARWVDLRRQLVAPGAAGGRPGRSPRSCCAAPTPTSTCCRSTTTPHDCSAPTPRVRGWSPSASPCSSPAQPPPASACSPSSASSRRTPRACWWARRTVGCCR